MEEKKYAVLLTDNQEIKILECDPQEEIFEIARGSLGCEWIELVEPDALSKNGYLAYRRRRETQRWAYAYQLHCQ